MAKKIGKMEWGPWQEIKEEARVVALKYCHNLSGRHVIEVEAEDGTCHIMAKLNFLGGVCDDCLGADRNLKAIRYRVMKV